MPPDKIGGEKDFVLAGKPAIAFMILSWMHMQALHHVKGRAAMQIALPPG